MKAKLTLENGRTIDIELTPEQEKAMEVKKVGRWKPKALEIYYFPLASSLSGAVEYIWKNDDTDNNFYKHGKVFKTAEEAQFYLDKQEFIVKVNDRIDELNDGWIPDWMNNQMKHYIYSYLLELGCSSTDTVRTDRVFHYMKSKEIAEQIISEFKDDLMKFIFN